MKDAAYLLMEGLLSYRVPMSVKSIVYYRRYAHSYPLCPRCESVLEREYMEFCSRCGQKLKWSGYSKAQVIMRG